MFPSMSVSVSSGTENRARFSVNESVSWPRRIPMVTELPSGPLTLVATSSVWRLVTSVPSTVTILSPFLMPARSAGVPGMTWTTSIGASGVGLLMVTPIPDTGGWGWLKFLARVGSR